jgi:hypothetical protein
MMASDGQTHTLDAKCNGVKIIILILTEEFAVDLDSSFGWRKLRVP